MLAFLHGDTTGVMHSKLLIGMLLPMGIAIAGAIAATHFNAWFWEYVQPRQPSKEATDPYTPAQEVLIPSPSTMKTERSKVWTHDLDLDDNPMKATGGYNRLSMMRIDFASPAPKRANTSLALGCSVGQPAPRRASTTLAFFGSEAQGTSEGQHEKSEP